MNIVDDLFMCLGDISGHMGRHIYGFYGFDGGHGAGQKK